MRRWLSINRNLLLSMIFFGLLNLFIMSGSERDLFSALASSNFITMIPNLFVITLIYRFLSFNERIKYLLVPRLGRFSYLWQQLRDSSLFVLLYLSVQYASNGYFFKIAIPERISIFWLFLIINLMVMLIEVCILNLIHLEFNKYVCFILAIILNLGFHYGIVLKILTSAYLQ